MQTENNMTPATVAVAARKSTVVHVWEEDIFSEARYKIIFNRRGIYIPDPEFKRKIRYMDKETTRCKVVPCIYKIAVDKERKLR